MKIFLTVSKTGTEKHAANYQAILKELEGHGVDVETTFEKTYLNENPELKKVKDLVQKEGEYKYAHDSAVRRAIFRADAVVIEATYPSFRLGFETFFALSQQKPVLVLSKLNNYGNLIDQPHFFGAKYTDFTLPDEVEKFIKHVRHYKLRNRFNLFISDNHKEHLEKTAKKYGVSMSDYLRKLVEQDMKN